jgi:DNA-binding transcriptional MerR regulator
MFTPFQVSEMTNVAPSTLRKYVAQFRHRLSKGTQTRRGRRFTEADVIVIKKIKELFANGLSVNEIETRLNTLGVSALVDMSVQTSENDMNLTSIQDAIYPASEVIERLEQTQKRHEEQIASLEIEMKQLRAALHRAKEDYDRLSRRIDELGNSSIWTRLSGSRQRGK